MARPFRSLLTVLLATVGMVALASPADAATITSGQCTVTASTPSAVYVSPGLRIQGHGSASCNYDWRYEFSLMTTLQEYSTYYHTWSTMATSQSPWYGGGGGLVNMGTTASYACINAQFRTVAQVQVNNIYHDPYFRTTPVYSATFTKTNC